MELSKIRSTNSFTRSSSTLKSLSHEIEREIIPLLQDQFFSRIGLALIDFNKNISINFVLSSNGKRLKQPFYFDLASLSKPLNLSLVHSALPQYFHEDSELNSLLKFQCRYTCIWFAIKASLAEANYGL